MINYPVLLLSDQKYISFHKVYYYPRRLEELDYHKSFLRSVEKKLSNDNFIKNAPEKVLILEKKKQVDAITKIDSLIQQISSF